MTALARHIICAENTMSEHDENYMRHALVLARRALGQVAPNPAVGCVIIRDKVIIGCGHTADGGRPHAEAQALAQAGSAAQGATAYVTLEPCAHHGQTPPCTDALIRAGVKRVVVAMTDPDENVNGKGIAQLRAAGIEVIENVLAQEAKRLNRGFVLHRTQNRPMVTLKIATCANGMMRTANKNPTQITAEAAQRRAHLIRAEHDAILVGRGTFEIDAPALTCRLSGMEDYSPRRFVAARSGLTAQEVKAKDFTLLPQPNPSEMLHVLATQGVTRLMLEGGATLARAFLAEDLVDEIAWFRAPHKLPIIEQSDLHFMGLENLPQNAKFQLVAQEDWPPDRLYLLRRQNSGE